MSVDLTPKEQKLNDNLDLFLMAICHQPYSELVTIPLSKRIRLLAAFREVMEQLFQSGGKKKEILNCIKGITDPNAYIEMQKRLERERS